MKDIKGYEGIYAVTEDGQVWSYIKNKFLRPTGKTYKGVCLCKDGKHTTYYVHRLVAEAYLPNPNNLPQVNHKDENPTNNHVNNLEWCDRFYNMNYGTVKQRLADMRKGTTLSDEYKSAIKHTCTEKYGIPVICVELNKVYSSIADATRETGFRWISACLHGRQKTAGGYHWRYANE